MSNENNNNVNNKEIKMGPMMRGRGPMGGMGGPIEKPKDFKGTLKILLRYLGKYKVKLIFVFIFAIGSTVFAIIGPKMLGNATTEIFNGMLGKISGGAGIDFITIGNILFTLIGLYVISMVFGYIQGFLMTDVSQKTTYNLRKEISEKIGRMPMKYFDKTTHGEVLSRITNDIDTLGQTLNQGITQVITAICSLIGITIMMLTISWQMTLVTVLILPLSLLMFGAIIKRSQKYFVKQQEYLGHVNGQVEETYGGHNIVKVFNREKESISEFNEKNEELYKAAWKSQFFSSIMHPIMHLVENIAYVAVAIMGGYYAIQGRIAVGEIQAFIQYSRQFTQPIGQLAQISSILQSTIAASERVFEFLNEDEELKNVKSPKNVDDLKGNVLFNEVRFGYNSDKVVIKNFNANIRDGQKIAIVGPTGAGKTTIVKLLMRFYDVNSGGIFIDENDIRDFDRDDIRRVFGMVLQDTWLFNGTIMENIRYGNLDATDEEVMNAARAAHVHRFIQTLPDGYNMVLNEEASNVSQGQKQLLTIARAILADPKILILDEATSSVDTRTEILIQKAMDNLMKGRTSFVIAHRLSTIRNADLILVMNEGDIIEQGTHEELIAANGFYTNLYNSQFKKDSVA